MLLVENSDRTVTKEEINETVWRGRIVSEAALSGRIKTLRQILGDDGKAQRVIRTVHKRGFRFVAPVEVLDEVESEAQVGVALPDRTTVAVLPFANLSSDAEQEYFSDGVSADIISHLSKHHWLNVIARNTTFSFKGKPLDAKELGRQLGAHYVVEGSVQRVGGRVRVSASLIDTQSGYQKWSERYDREISDLFILQDEITETIAARLEPEIGFAERNRIVRERPGNLQAWDCFHLGIYHFYEFTGEGNQKAQALLKRSQELDARFGEAYAWWAYAVVLGMVYWDTPPDQSLLDEALAACDTALVLDRQNASFMALRARVLLARREYGRAMAENQKAIDLNPAFALAHCCMGDSLAYEGRYEEAVACFERSISLSPNDPQIWAFYSYGALAFLFMREFDSALDWTEEALSIPNCQYWALAHQAVALAYLDRVEEARRCVVNLQAKVPGFSLKFAREKMFYLKRPEQIELYLRGLELAGVSPG